MYLYNLKYSLYFKYDERRTKKSIAPRTVQYTVCVLTLHGICILIVLVPFLYCLCL